MDTVELTIDVEQEVDDDPEKIQKTGAASLDLDHEESEFAELLLAHRKWRLSDLEGLGLNPDAVACYDPATARSGHVILRIQNAYRTLVNRHGTRIKDAMCTVLILGYILYFASAVAYSVDGAMALIVITSLVISVIVYDWLKKCYGVWINDAMLTRLGEMWERNWSTLKW